MDIERVLGEALVGIDLSSTARNKFDNTVRIMEAALGVDGLVVKALGASKNFGNRISEATGAGAAHLVLVTDGAVRAADIHRIYLARAVRRIPTLVVANTAGRWQPVVVLASGPHPFPDDIQTLLVPAKAESNAVPRGIIDDIMALNGSSKRVFDAEAERLQELYPDSFVLKRISDPKNLLNRVREALGRRPAILLAVGPPAVAKKLNEALRDQTELSGAALSAIDNGESVHVQLVCPPRAKADDEQMTPEHIQPDLFESNETEPSYQVNRTVADLSRYLPFDAAAGNLYEEHIHTNQRLEFDTVALKFIKDLIRDDAVTMVVLTGNAGHGKTHLCRRLISESGAKPTDAMAAMSGDLVGEVPIELPGLARQVRILKDLSEIEPAESAATRLVELLEDTNTLAIVCANEGRLRHVVSSDRGRLGMLVETLEAGIRRGATTADGTVHVVNLNFQAVTPPSGESFLDFALDHWLGHGNRWRKCTDCLAAGTCPILANRTALSLSPETRSAAQPVRTALTHLVRLAEQTGYVLTIREALILVAFVVTGGLDCQGVHSLHRGQRLAGFSFLESLFERELPPNDMRQLGILERIRRFDPGRTAIRSIDERLHQELEWSGGLGDSVLEVGARPPSTRDQLRREQREHLGRIRHARRRDYFTEDSGNTIGRSRRLGLLHHEDFLDLQNAQIDGTRMLGILDRLVMGLHVVQGIRASGESSGVLFIVDPAFSRSANRSAVIAHQFDQTSLELVGEAAVWRETEGDPQLLRAVDWLDRRVVLVYKEDEHTSPTMVLDFDLIQFEFVMRAATGVVFQEFNAAERKRIVSLLARIAEQHPTSRREIRVMEGGVLRRLILERDNSFRVATVG